MAKEKLVFSEDLKQAINHVNQDVVYDLPENASYAMIAEVCLDANRLTTWGHPEADNEVSELIKKFGYEKVLREAKKHVCKA